MARTVSKTQATFDGLTGQSIVHLSPFQGIDYSKQAFLFCGQGQMSPGIMQDEVRTSTIFQRRFEELDSICMTQGLGSPSRYILEPDTLNQSERNDFSPLALYALQVSMFEIFLVQNEFPKLLSAHSFGEFSQIVASGCIEYRDMIDVLALRQQALKDVSGSYTMFAVSNSDRMTDVNLEQECYLANINTQSQTTYVCLERDFKSIKAALRTQKVACVKVDVNYPFHSPWLADARSKLLKNIEQKNLTVHPPKIPFVSSVTGEIVSETTFNRDMVLRLLADQLVTQVNFPAQIEKIVSEQVASFVEFSPVDVLNPFVEQILSTKDMHYNLSSYKKRVRKPKVKGQGFESFANSKILTVFNKALKTLTGYSVEGIELEDKIREDLGIDSIKKAELVFEIADSMKSHGGMESAPLNLGEISTFGDILNYFDRSEKAKKASSAETEERGKEFFLLKKTMSPATLVDYSSYKKLDLKVYDFRDIRDGKTTIESSELVVIKVFSDSQKMLLLEEFLWWIEFFKQVHFDSQRLIVHHHGDIFAKSICAFLSSYAQEKKSSFKAIESRSEMTPRDYYVESLDFHSSVVSYDNDQVRQVRGFANIDIEAAKDIGPTTKILAFGGLGGIGKHLLMALKEFTPSTICVVGRRPLDHNVQNEIDALGFPAGVVRYFSVDATDRAAIAGLIKNLEVDHGRFDMAIHSVGVTDSKMVAQMPADEIKETMHAKVVLADELADWSLKNPQGRVVLCSTIISEFGNIGQSTYALANKYLNVLAENHDNIISILWPAWESTGVTDNEFVTKTLILQGLPSMTASEGRRLFVDCLRGNEDTYFVLNPEYLPEDFSFNQFRSEMQGLLQPVSRDQKRHFLSGVTQDRMPYLKDHLIKRVCLLPASGSIAFILFRFYQQTGRLGTIRNFMAHNFLIVAQDSSSHFLESTNKSPSEVFFQIRSNQLVVESEVFIENQKEAPPPSSDIMADYKLDSTFDQNFAVYIGPTFELDQGRFLCTKTDRLFLKVDLDQSPRYTGVPIIDKVHKLMEASFNAAYTKSILDHEIAALPKTAETIRFYDENLAGHSFFPTVEKVDVDENGSRCSVQVYNSNGAVAIEIHGLKMISIGERAQVFEKEKGNFTILDISSL